MYRVLLSLVAVLLSQSIWAKDYRFLQQINLPDNHSVLQVAEGENEPRSIGSYSIRLYGGHNPDFPLDDFITGLIVAREGVVERVFNIDGNGDGIGEVVVVIRSAGSGGYLTFDVFDWQNKQLKRILSLSDLPPKADPVVEVKRVMRKP